VGPEKENSSYNFSVGGSTKHSTSRKNLFRPHSSRGISKDEEISGEERNALRLVQILLANAPLTSNGLLCSDFKVKSNCTTKEFMDRLNKITKTQARALELEAELEKQETVLIIQRK
jgi:hypothetical protein